MTSPPLAKFSFLLLLLSRWLPRSLYLWALNKKRLLCRLSSSKQYNSVADLGGAQGPGPPLSFRPTWDTNSRKNCFFGDRSTPQPTYQRVWTTGVSLISGSGTATSLFKTLTSCCKKMVVWMGKEWCNRTPIWGQCSQICQNQVAYPPHKSIFTKSL